jgi:amino acid adenylation domain-containing protein
MTDLRRRIVALSAEQRAKLEARVADLVMTREPARSGRIQPRDRSRPTPLGIAQQREWTIERIRAANNINGAFRIEGALALDLLSRVFTEVTERHEVLRSTVELHADGVPVQVVHPVSPVPTPVVDLSDVGADEQRDEVRRHCKAAILRRFAPDDPQRLRVMVLRLAADVHVVLLTTDHASCDAWPLSIVVQEIVTLYGIHQSGHGSLQPPDIQFGDFAAWQRELFDEERVAAELAHWRETLDGIDTPPGLPSDRPYPARPTFVGDVHVVNLSPELTAGLRSFGERENASLLAVLSAACYVLLHRYLQDDDLVIGSLVSGRSRVETEQLIGCFANPLPLRLRLSGEQTLREVAQRARETMTTALDHQDVPFDRLIERLGLGREASQTSLSRLWINILTVPANSLELPGLSITPEPIDLGLASVDLTLSAVPQPDSLQLQWHYMVELFESATIALLSDQYNEILRQLVSAPDTEVRRVALAVAPASPMAAAAPPKGAERGFVELFERRVSLAPHAPAVICDGAATSYAELNQRANRLARDLRARGVGSEARVGVLVDRSPQLAVAILGVLKAGAAFLPLDPTYPPDRLAFMLADADARVLVTRPHLADLVAGTHPPGDVVLLDDAAADAGGDADDLSDVPELASLAYVIYTSGSTGRPKGAMVEHGSLATFACDVVDRLGLGASDRFLQFASPGFDVLIEELFPTWLAGGAVVIPTEHLMRGEGDLVDLLERERVTVIELPTAYWHEWVRELERLERTLPDCLRLVIIGGERVLAQRLAAWQRFGVPLAHVYGLTETTVSSTFFRLDAADGEAWPNLPIGTPLPSADLRILDRRLARVPVGGIGELHMGGVSVARGYLGRPGLTAQRFVADPDPRGAGRRLYRTGDLVRQRPDGNLEFISRVDTQIKVRGFRVEPAEIESALSRHPGIAQSVVTLHEPTPGDRRLVAYVVPEDAGAAPDVGALRRHLERELPSYMVPSTFVELDAPPLNANGKVDRAQLPPPDGGRLQLDEEYVAPRTPLQRQLAEIVAAVVGVDQVGIHDNFFDLGGDSIQAIQVVARAQEAGIGLSPLDFFEKPTIALLAQAATDANPDNVIHPRPPDAEPVLSYDQERLWLEHQLRPRTAYHVGGRHRLVGPLQVDVLEASIRAILERHEILRTRFPVVDGRPVPVVDGVNGWRLEVVDLSGAEDREEASKRLLDEDSSRAFDLAEGPLLRCLLTKLSDTEHVLNITSHHVVSDNWSIGIFGLELAALYAAGGDPRRAGLPELPIQYRDFAVWQRQHHTGETLERKVDYWRRHLAGAPPAITMPTPPKTPGAGGGRRMTALSERDTAALHELCRTHGVTPFMVVLASLATVLRRWSGQPDVVIGTSVSGRTDVALENLIGVFINTMPLRVDLSGDPTFAELLRRARQVALDGYAYSDAPFDVLVKELQVPRDPRRTPLFQVVLNVFELPTIEHLGDVELKGQVLPELLSSFDLVFTAQEAAGVMHLRLEFDAQQYPLPMMEVLLEHLRTMLGAVAADPSRGILDYALPPVEPVTGEVVAPSGRPGPALHLAVERHAGQPDRVAVADRDGERTYRWLDQAASRVAQALLERGAAAGDRVAVAEQPTAEFVAAVVGCARAGLACSVVRPGDDAAREPGVALDGRDGDAAAWPEPATDWVVERLGLGADDRVAVLSSKQGHLLSAMASAFEAGATLVVPDRPLGGGSGGLADWLLANAITAVYVTPPILRLLTAAATRPRLPELRHVFVDNPGGDLIAHDVDALRKLWPTCRCVTLYRTGHDGRPLATYTVPDDWRLDTAPPRVPLGIPLEDAAATLRHPSGQPATVGEVAEICFGAERTGHLGRRWHDGTLEFVGTVPAATMAK